MVSEEASVEQGRASQSQSYYRESRLTRLMPRKRSADPKAVDAYVARVPPPFREALQALRRTIKAAAPEAEEVISYGMPAFRQRRIIVYYAAFRDHCSLFGGAEIRRKFARELKAFPGGRSTIQFTPEHPLPVGLVKRIVKSRLAGIAARQSR
jgi:uncharacterized protein YdhG (YjbR/CyaY superfamily)